MKHPLPDQPFLDGVLIGILLPGAAVLTTFLLADLNAWLTGGAVYGLMPVFAVLAIPAFLLTRRLRGIYAARGLRPIRFTNGLLVGAWLVGVVLLWSSSPATEPVRRLAWSATGAILLVGFWVWIGSLLAHAPSSRESAALDQTQTISSPPR